MDKYNQCCLDTLNKYLSEVIKYSYRCAHCALYHPKENVCFFAYECIKNDFNHWTDEEI